MKLLSLSVRGMMGRDFSLDLAPAMVFTGGNFAGKTEIFKAVELLLVGYCAALGKTNAATFALCDGAELVVSGQVEDGLVVYALNRRWYLSGNSVKTEFSMPDPLLARLGDADLAVMLNANEYFALGPTDRVRYVAAHCPAAPMSDDAIMARVVAVLPVETVTAEPTPTRAATFSHAFPAWDENEMGGPEPEFIDRCLEVAANFWKSAKDHAKRMEGTVQGITGLRANDTPTRHVDEILAERGRTERELATLSENKGRLLGAFTAMKSAEVRRTSIRRELDAMAKDLLKLPDLRFKAAQIGTQIVAAGVTVTEQQVSDTVKALNSAIDDLKTLRRMGADATGHQLTLDREIQSVEKEAKCPYCGATGEGWKALKLAELARDHDAYKSLADQHAAGIPGVEKIVERFTAEHRALVDRRQLHVQLAGALAATEAAINRLTPLEAKSQALAAELDALNPYDPTLADQVETLQAQINTLNDEAQALDEETREANGRARDKERLAQAEADRDRAKEDMAAWALVGAELKKVQAELVDAAFKPLIEAANAVFPGIMQTPLAYRDGEIGTWRDGVWVSHKAFSGAEQKLTFAAIQGALSASSPMRIMLLDELGVFRSETAIKVANAVETALAAGRLTQFLGIDPERPHLYDAADSAFKVLEIR